MKAHEQGALQFTKLVQPFLSVLRHEALLSFLSVDSCIGGLYNFPSGRGDARGIPFFREVTKNLFEISDDGALASLFEKTVVSMLTALLELLRREEEVASHDTISRLIELLEPLFQHRYRSQESSYVARC